MLFNIYSCITHGFENTRGFATGFTSAVTSYINHTACPSASVNIQLVTLLLGNAKQSPGTINSIIFQLTSSITSKIEKCIDTTITAVLLNYLMRVVDGHIDEPSNEDKSSLKRHFGC